MNKEEKNRQFILNFYKAISGVGKNKRIISIFTSDPKLIDHILFFEKIIPEYEIIIDEITSEDDRVIVRARSRGRHTGMTEGVLPTFRVIETPFAIGYRIKKDLIVDHWIIVDQMRLLEQLGMARPAPQ